MRIVSLSFLVLWLLSSCSISKYVPEGRQLYKGSLIEFDGDVELAEEEKVRGLIEEQIFPKPNQKFLGLVYFNLWVYFSFDEAKAEWYSRLLYDRFAKEPTYVTDVNGPIMEQVILKIMQDEGYFGSQITTLHLDGEQAGFIKYVITPARPTYMRRIDRKGGTTELDQVVGRFRKYSAKVGERYRLEAFEIERLALAKYVRSQGFYDFNVDEIYYLVDTTSIDSVDITMRIKPPKGDSLHRKYYMSDINVYTTNGAEGSGGFSDENFAYSWKGLDVYEDFRFIDKKTLASNILIERGQVFSIENYNLTLSRLVNLNIFKYVNIQYIKSAPDSLSVNILLTPTQYKNLNFDTELNTSDRSFLGSTISAGFSNANALRRAEKLSFSLAAGAELQYNDSKLGFSILTLKASARYEVPRLIVPFKTRKFRSSVAPLSFASLENDYQLWLQYFNYNSTKATFGYKWKTENRFTFTAEPFFVDFLNVFRTTDLFAEYAQDRPLLLSTYQDQLIIGSLFSIGHTNRVTKGQRNSYFLRWNLETAGNTSTLFTKEISEVPISQYFRTELEYRFTRKFTYIENLIARINIGVVHAYGNSANTPFTKQFYMGGPTTLRGFSFRSVGPGRFRSENADQTVNNIDQFGDIRLLMNVEYRFPIYSVFRGATFFDAGNVWLLDKVEGRDDGQFKWNEFYKEVAWNTGLGLRLDVEYIAARLDLGIPLYSPYEVEGERWIHQSPEQGVFPWLGQNVVLSLGIGYPF